MEKYSVNFAAKTLTITKKFAEKAADPTSAEYKVLARLKKDFPDFHIVNRTHKTPTKYTEKKSGDVYKRNPSKGLTYENMERFMAGLPNNEDYFTQYWMLRDFALNPYALVRKWFVEQFPKYRKDPLFYLHNAPILVKADKVIEEAETDEEAA